MILKDIILCYWYWDAIN